MIDASDRQQLDEIAFVLAERTKPTLVCISVGSYRKRDELCRELGRLLPQNSSATLDLSGHPITSLFRAVREGATQEVLNSQPGEYLLHIFGIEDSLFIDRDGKLAASSIIEELNLERENLFHEFPCCLILWTTPHFVDKLRRDAPDLWDWITYSYHFPDRECAHFSEDSAEPFVAPDGVTEERTARISDMEERLQRLSLDNNAPERVLRSKLGLYKALGVEYQGAFRTEDAIRYNTAALSLLGQISHANIDEAVIRFRLGDSHLLGRNFAEALSSYKISLRIQQENEVRLNIGATWHQIGRVHEEQRNWALALKNYQKALSWYEKTGQHHKLGGVWHQIGRVYQLQRNWPQSLDSYQKALELNEKNGQHHWLGSTWHQIGILYQLQQNLPKALESYQKALEWKERSGQHHELASTFHHIGMVYQLQWNWPQALKNYQRALDLSRKSGQFIKLGRIWHQIGRLYEEQREWPQALESYQKALEWKEISGQRHDLGSTWHQIGKIFEEQGYVSEALRNYLLAMDVLIKTGMEHDIGILLNSLRRILPKLSQEEREELKNALPEELPRYWKQMKRRMLTT